MQIGKTHPLDRDAEPYRRPEFVASLQIPVITTRQLFDWWRVGNHAGLREAVVGVREAVTSTVGQQPSGLAPVDESDGVSARDDQRCCVADGRPGGGAASASPKPDRSEAGHADAGTSTRQSLRGLFDKPVPGASHWAG